MEEVLQRPTRPRDVVGTLRALLPALPQPQKIALFLVVLTALEVASQVGVALCGKYFLDGILAATPTVHWGWIGLAATLAVLYFLLTRARQVQQEKFALIWRQQCVERLSHNITAGAYEELAAVPMAALREIIMTDAPFLTRFFVETSVQGVVLAFWLIGATALLLFLLSPLLAVVVGGLLVGAAAATWFGARRHLRLTQVRFERLAELSQRARDVAEIDRILLTRQFGLGDRFVRLFIASHEAFATISLRQARLSATVRALIQSLGGIGFVGIAGVGGYLIWQGSLEAGAVFALLFVVGQMLAAVTQLGDLAGRGAEAATAGKRLSAYWYDASTPEADSRRAAPAKITTVTAANVSFAYPDGPRVIDDLTFTLQCGDLTALTAATGTGKTTFGLLISGILAPTTGQIFLNANDDLPVQTAAPGQILYVGPKPILIAGSVRDNLFTDKIDDAPLDEIWQALFRDRPATLDETLIQTSGTGLSSGQGQLVQLARAVAQNPDVVIFDEATGALDMETEARVQAALLDWCRERICLVISHRACPWTEHADQHERW